MKTCTFKQAASLLLCCLITTASAKEIYLSSNGKDKNDGTTPATAVKTLSKALSLADKGDEIKVSGFIDISKEPTSDQYGNGCYNLKGNQGVKFPNKALTITGDNRETCGFDGKSNSGNGTGCLRLDGVYDGLTVKNLTIKNGDPCGDKGGGAYIRGGKITFDNCAFIDNRNYKQNNGTTRGGAIYYEGNHPDSKLTLNKCIFKGNLNKEGSDIFFSNGTLLADGCSFEGTDAGIYAGSEGGVLKTTTQGDFNDIVFRNSVIRNYKVDTNGAAFSLKHLVKDKNLNLRVENCLIYNNQCLKYQGGVCIVDNSQPSGTDKVAFINTTMYGNKAMSGGAIMLDQVPETTSTFDLINCTIVGNDSQSGGGIRINNRAVNMTKRIYNCILEGNTEKGERPSDLSIQYNDVNENELVIKNSFIGAESSNKLSDGFATESQMNYTPNGISCGLVENPIECIQKLKCIPLKDNSQALKAGNAQYLKEVGVYVDQLQKTRPYSDNKCAAGAIENPIGKIGK